MTECCQTIHCLQEKLTHFGLKVSVVYLISILYKLDSFKYFLIYVLRQMSQKIKQEKF